MADPFMPRQQRPQQPPVDERGIIPPKLPGRGAHWEDLTGFITNPGDIAKSIEDDPSVAFRRGFSPRFTGIEAGGGMSFNLQGTGGIGDWGNYHLLAGGRPGPRFAAYRDPLYWNPMFKPLYDADENKLPWLPPQFRDY